ncbi:MULTISPECIES: hypothetical protein [unclassified Pseudomonas]|uniref:hypothetical protein n=1 Tax=unclassified Pseudomonas TaxID=196821 RepID=UPI0039B76B84
MKGFKRMRAPQSVFLLVCGVFSLFCLADEVVKFNLNVDFSMSETPKKIFLEQGHESACKWIFENKKHLGAGDKNSLGVCYLFGRYVEHDFGFAERWMKLAAEEGDTYAPENLKKMAAVQEQIRQVQVSAAQQSQEPLSERHKAELDATVNARLPVASGRFAWEVTTNGARPTGYLVMENTSDEEATYVLSAYYKDENNEVRTSGSSIVSVPEKSKFRAWLPADASYQYPSESWTYKIVVKNALSGAELFNYESVLPVDYAGQILPE